MSQCNLVLVVWHGDPVTRCQLKKIAGLVNEADGGVRAFVVEHHKLDQLKLVPLWWKPTLSLSFPFIPKRKLLPGRFLSGVRLDKPGEYARLEAAGIPVPTWTVVTHDMRLDPAEWGPYVVEKPAAGRRGANVRIRKTTRVQFQAPETYPEGHFGRVGPMMAQRFVYSGEWPTSYRVVTLFGETLLCYRQATKGRGYPLSGRWNFRATGGISVVSNTKQMVVEPVVDPAVIALAEHAHRSAFRDFPVLAFDLVRDADTGGLFVLECHAHGGWIFSSQVGLDIQASNNVNLEKQFDAIAKTARILMGEASRLAEVSPPWRDDRFDRLAAPTANHGGVAASITTAVAG
jgi:hypothetical protein